jgi:dCTP deaminase
VSGIWSSETLRIRLTTLVEPFKEERIKHGCYELSLGSEVFITGQQGETKRVLDSAGEQIKIPPGQFASLLTEETITIPSSSLGLLSMKFKIKKSGLINVSGFHVDPGFSGKLLFSVYNAGPSPTILARGDPVFLLWLCDLDHVTEDTYPNNPPRTSITAEDVSQLQGKVSSPEALALRVEVLENKLKFWQWLGGLILAAFFTALFAFGLGWGYHSGPPNSPTTSTTINTTIPLKK